MSFRRQEELRQCDALWLYPEGQIALVSATILFGRYMTKIPISVIEVAHARGGPIVAMQPTVCIVEVSTICHSAEHRDEGLSQRLSAGYYYRQSDGWQRKDEEPVEG